MRGQGRKVRQVIKEIITHLGHRRQVYPVGCIHAADASADGKTIYLRFAEKKVHGIYGLDAENYNGVTFPVRFNNQECTVIGVHGEQNTEFFNDALSRQVKRLDVMIRNIFVVAGSGSSGHVRWQ